MLPWKTCRMVLSASIKKYCPFSSNCNYWKTEVQQRDHTVEDSKITKEQFDKQRRREEENAKEAQRKAQLRQILKNQN